MTTFIKAYSRMCVYNYHYSLFYLSLKLKVVSPCNLLHVDCLAARAACSNIGSEEQNNTLKFYIYICRYLDR